MQRALQQSRWLAALAAVMVSAGWHPNLGVAQTQGISLQYLPPTFWRVSDTVGRTPSSNYLFSPASGSFTINRGLSFNLPSNADQHTFLFGPEFHLHLGDRITFNAWAMTGMAKRFALMNPFKQPTDATPPRYGLSPSVPMSMPAFNGANGLAVTTGASVDYRILDGFVYRPVQAEYLRVQVNDSFRRDVRISTGLRFSFGK